MLLALLILGFVVLIALAVRRDKPSPEAHPETQLQDGPDEPIVYKPGRKHRAKASPARPAAPSIEGIPIGPMPERMIVVDCETTGLGASKHRIVSIAMIEVRAGVMQPEAWTYLVFNPERPSDPIARRVHGWEDGVLALQDRFAAHAEDLHAKLRNAPLVVAHNAGFDLSFINAEMDRAGLPVLDPPIFCTMRAAREVWPGQSAKFDLCIRRIGLERKSKFHGASEDAALAAALCVAFHGQPIAKDDLAYPAMPSNLRGRAPATAATGTRSPGP